MQNKNIIYAFFGTPDVASNTLQILLDRGLIPRVVITNSDKPKGRGLLLQPSPVKKLAQEKNIEVIEKDSIDFDFADELQNIGIELAIVVAYGAMIPENVVNKPRHGTINIHYSLLPKYRGASPLESALLKGDTETGVTIQKMAKKLDTGPIIAQQTYPVAKDTTKDALREALINLGAELLINTLPDYLAGNITLVEQDESKATHCGKTKKEDGLIDIEGDDQINYNKYRAYSGWPGVYFFENGKRIKVTSARLEDGKFIIEKVIPEGKKETEYKKTQS